jgi:hypothetical protein
LSSIKRGNKKPEGSKIETKAAICNPVNKMTVAQQEGTMPPSAAAIKDDPVECLRRFKEHSTQCIRNAYEYVVNIL